MPKHSERLRMAHAAWVERNDRSPYMTLLWSVDDLTEPDDIRRLMDELWELAFKGWDRSGWRPSDVGPALESAAAKLESEGK